MIEKVTYTTMDDGSLKGVQYYKVDVNDQVEYGLNEAVDAIYKITHHNAQGCKLVFLDGKFTADNQSDLFSMVKSLTDAGYSVGCYSNGKAYFPWMTMLVFISVMPEGNWLGFKVTEFIWYVNQQGKPLLPPNPEKTNLFVAGSPVERLAFMKASPLHWRVWGVGAVEEVL